MNYTIKYIDYIKAIKSKRSDAMIAVEMSPPELECQQLVFKKLKEAGADSITINIEFWNDTVRKRLMPMKGAISKAEYISSYENALKYFGSNKVACGFIVGIESADWTKKGIDDLSKIGVITEVYPFKPNNGCSMENHCITKIDEIIDVSLYANESIRRNSIVPSLCSGCVKCGACGLTQNLLTI